MPSRATLAVLRGRGPEASRRSAALPICSLDTVRHFGHSALVTIPHEPDAGTDDPRAIDIADRAFAVATRAIDEMVAYLTSGGFSFAEAIDASRILSLRRHDDDTDATDRRQIAEHLLFASGFRIR